MIQDFNFTKIIKEVHVYRNGVRHHWMLYYDISLEQYFSTSQAELQSAGRTGAYIQECLTA